MTTPTVEQTAPYRPPPPDPGMTDEQLAELLTLVQVQAATRQHLTEAAVAATLAAFAGFHDWWNPDATKKAIKQALKVVVPAQRQAAVTTDGYLTRVARLMTGKAGLRPAGAVDVTKLRRVIPDQIIRELVAGTRTPPFVILGDTHGGPGPDINVRAPLSTADPAIKTAFQAAGEAYGRVAEQYRYAVTAKGDTEADAEKKAMVRLGVTAENDVTAAVRAQYHKTMGAQQANGYRRILHPELSKTGPCGLCVVAADRLYHIEELMPIHGRCVCETLPVYGRMDPGISLNWRDLDALYRAAGSTGGGKRQGGALKKIRVALAENGELGPVLVDADQAYRGPVQVAKAVSPDRRVSARAQLAALEKSFETLQHRQMAGANVDKPIAYQRQQIDKLRRELATLG